MSLFLLVDTKDTRTFVSRAGLKLEHALKTFGIDVAGKTCADFGASTGGFTDCLLQNGVTKVYSVETGYGVLDWKLRNDPRVVVLERENAMHITLLERVSFITVDVSWTKLEKVLPNVLANLSETGEIIALLKPHYEAPHLVRKGRLSQEDADTVKNEVLGKLTDMGVRLLAITKSPIVGERAGNIEYLLHLKPIGA